MGCFDHFCSCQELRPSLTEQDIKRGSKKRELDELRRDYLEKKGFTVIEMWEYEWWRLYKTTSNVKLHIRENFPNRRSVTEHQLFEKIKKRNLFGYVHCDIEVPETLKVNFASFSPIFKNTLVGKDDNGHLMKTYVEEERIMSQPRKMLISSFILQNGTLITPHLLLYLQLGLVVTKIHRIVEYTPKKCFNSFVQAAVDARRKNDKNPNSTVIAETMKVLANNSNGYRYLNRSRHTVTKYLSDGKRLQLLIVNSSKSWIMCTIHCEKLNWPTHRLNTTSQTFSGNSVFNTQNCECWSFTTTSSPNSVI